VTVDSGLPPASCARELGARRSAVFHPIRRWGRWEPG